MILARALVCCLGSGGILLFAGTTLVQTDTAPAPAASVHAPTATELAPTAAVLTQTAPAPTQTNVDASSIDAVDECPEVCIDRYLWSLYERTPKIDTLKVSEKRKVIVKRKHKNKIVTITITKLLDEDFTWKDPKAAERAGMSLADYVIGGMDRNFRVTLYHALRALDEAGFAPGITSAFRDDYRQMIATGLKAQTDRSYHGGSFRGGYGHGLAADIVSVNGETRSARWVASQQLWKWIDAHEKELGIARPYLDVDAPHVAPIDGKEFADHRVQPKTQQAESHKKDAKGHRGLAQHHDHGSSKHTRTARSSKMRSG
jgi:hypothetical protein